MKNGFFRVIFEQPLEISFKKTLMKFICLLAFVIILSSCSKTSEFAAPTATYFIIPANKTLTTTDTISIDSIPTNFAYTFQANQTSVANVKQIQVQEVDFTIINNSYGQNFNFIQNLKVSLSVGEKTVLDTVVTYTAPITPTYVTFLQLSSQTDASKLINSDNYNLSVSYTSNDSIPEDVQIQANILFYVKAKTD